VVKALYDYEATSNDELTISENDILLAYDTDDDWLLVQTAEGGGRAGYVPVTYVEPNDDEGEPSAPAAAPHIVVPDSVSSVLLISVEGESSCQSKTAPTSCSSD